MPTMPSDPVRRALLLEALEAQRRLRAAEEEADQQRAIFRAAVARAHAAGATMREIGAALDITHARAKQIIDAERASQPLAGGA